MSDYIQIPNSITTKLTKKSKQEEAFVYALIRNEIKDNFMRSSFSQSQLVDFFIEEGVILDDEQRVNKERTINSYIASLKDTGLLKVINKKKGGSDHRYNVYQFDYLTDDYFILLPQFLCDKNISPKLKGLLLFIKANCWSGTNYLTFNGRTTDLPTMLGVGKNQLKNYLEELEVKGYIRYIDKSLHITNENFPLFINDDMDNITYKIIYDYCLSKNTKPPIKDVDKRGKDKDLSWIVGKYQNEFDPSDKERRPYGRLIKALKTRCSNLPKEVTLNYFCQVLCNKKPLKDNMQRPEIFLE